MFARLGRTLPCLALLAVTLGATAQPSPADPAQPSPTAPAQPSPTEQAQPPPPAAAELTLGQLLAQRGYSAVALRDNVFGQLETDALLAGEHKLRVGVSTSFSKTIFDQGALEALGFDVEATNVELSVGGKKQKLGSVRLPSLMLGATQLGAATIYSMDLAAILGSNGGEPVQGMIGSDFLTKYQAVLEVAGPTLYLRVR